MLSRIMMIFVALRRTIWEAYRVACAPLLLEPPGLLELAMLTVSTGRWHYARSTTLLTETLIE